MGDKDLQFTALISDLGMAPAEPPAGSVPMMFKPTDLSFCIPLYRKFW